MSTSHQAMFNLFKQADPRTMGFIKFLDEIYPAFAAKIFKSTGVMSKFVKSGLNSSDILDNFICGHCEALAPWNGYAMDNGRPVPKCTCMECGSTTINPPTLRQWMHEELRHKAPPEVLALGEIVVDTVAARMFSIAQQQLAQEISRELPQKQKQMGILMPDGTEVPVQRRAKIEVNERPLTDEEFRKKLAGTQEVD